MRILFVMQNFHPEPNFFFGLPFAKELVNRGHQVQVITGFPHYPGEKIYQGYKIKILQKEILDGIPVYRFPLYPSHSRSSFKRIICYISLAFSMTVLAPWVIKSADVAFVVQGPATIGFPATILKWFRRIPFIYNIQDLWPDSLLSTGMFDSKYGVKALHKWCNFVYHRASKITVIAPGMKQKLIERGVAEQKVDVVYNWCDETFICRSKIDDKLKVELGFAGKFNIVFAGNMGKAQALEASIQAAKLLQPKYPNIQFVFIGPGVEVEKLKNLTQSLDLKNVLFLPQKPMAEIGLILRQADVLYVHLKKDPLFSITIPSKTQAYLAIGRPILMAVEGDAAQLVAQAGAGLSCEPQNAESIANGVASLFHLTPEQREQMGAAGLKFYGDQLSFAKATSYYEATFKKIQRHPKC